MSYRRTTPAMLRWRHVLHGFGIARVLDRLALTWLHSAWTLCKLGHHRPELKDTGWSMYFECLDCGDKTIEVPYDKNPYWTDPNKPMKRKSS